MRALFEDELILVADRAKVIGIFVVGFSFGGRLVTPVFLELFLRVEMDSEVIISGEFLSASCFSVINLRGGFGKSFRSA